MSTRVLNPGKAVIWAAFFNFVAAFGFGTAVAKTVGSGMIAINVVTFAVIFSGLFGAITWDLITWYFGLPTSSSHALIGGYAGAAIAKAGWDAIIAAGWTKTLIFIVVSPLIGLTAGLLLIVAIYWLSRRSTPSHVDHWFRKLQLVSAALFSLNHGANDAQKTMGIIAGVLFTVPAYRYMQSPTTPLNVHISVVHTGELAPTKNDKITFLPLNSESLLIFRSVSTSSNSGALSPTFTIHQNLNMRYINDVEINL